MTDAFFMTATICMTALAALTIWVQAKPRTDRWQEMERVMSTLEVRLKVLERHVPIGGALVDLVQIKELREEMSKRHHLMDNDLREMQAEIVRIGVAVEAVGSELKRRLEVVNQLSTTVGSMMNRGGGMRT